MTHRLSSYAGILLLVAGLFFQGCSVSPPPPTHYYILNNPSPPKGIVNAIAKYPVGISLGEISIAAPFNSENLVVKLKDNEVQFFNYEKWGAPPEKMLQDFFYKTLIFHNLFQLADRRTRNSSSYHLELEFEELAQNREQSTHFASLKMFARMSQKSSSVFNWYKAYQISIPTESDQPADIVKAINKGLEQLVNQLSIDLESFLFRISQQK